MAGRNQSDLAREISEALEKIRGTLSEEEFEKYWEDAVIEAASDEVQGGLVRGDEEGLPEDED